MSAKTVTDNGGTDREAVLRAMQEAAESAAGKNGVPKGPKGTRGIVMPSNDASWTDPEDKKKKKKGDEDDYEDEGSELSSIRPRNLSYSSQSERGPRSPAKRKKKAAWPPRGGDDKEEDRNAWWFNLGYESKSKTGRRWVIALLCFDCNLRRFSDFVVQKRTKAHRAHGQRLPKGEMERPSCSPISGWRGPF